MTEYYYWSTEFPLDFLYSLQAYRDLDLRSLFARLENEQRMTREAKIRYAVDYINQQAPQQQALPKKEGAQPIASSHFHALGLLTEIYHYIFAKYRYTVYPNLWPFICERLSDKKSLSDPQKREKFLQSLANEIYFFNAHYKEKEISALIRQDFADRSGEELLFEELFHLHILHLNPALQDFSFLFDNNSLLQTPETREFIETLKEVFASLPRLPGKNNDFYQSLVEPFQKMPHSLWDQLYFIRGQWQELLPDSFLNKLQRSLDYIQEEWAIRGHVEGPPDTFVPDYNEQDLFPEYDAFTLDKNWMPKVILLAKSTYVWLYQLSRKYGYDISRLDQIPDQELDQIAAWGFTALWLIGLWERSPASQTIKRIKGNPEAISSAYSLYNYSIAETLGGEEALADLKERLGRRGIRLAADMVPNHTGIYSEWVVNKPHYFMSLPYPPYPNYQYTGIDLSNTPPVEVKIEDGYWNQTEAAVTFQRVDHETGDVRYIYHGNDGTSTPWNDTAQLDFSQEEVRQAVIEQILSVARRFSIIRFDAAMTLSNRHIQRLWFPLPGQGGAIPSRTEFSLSQKEFQEKFPYEFWRAVVDRVREEGLDTLLLAEAFWMMEGYFVRTLGMHRVYNSAFMNMLHKEENAKYRRLIKETLEFNPEILKRYVNYMNNPDEETAVAQFGKGDKYFGVALMMATLPGLPMWGHGQIEGFTEKYGMEYARSYYEEEPDYELVRNHEKLIFPLMKKRYLFAEVDRFQLYDLYRHDSTIDENIFAYSNMAGEERALIVYNNQYHDSAGWIHKAAPVNRSANSEQHDFDHSHLTQALQLDVAPDCYILFRDHPQQKEYIRHSIELSSNGLFVHVKGYEAHAFINFEHVTDTDGSWYRLMTKLGGAGVVDIHRAHFQECLEPLWSHMQELVSLDNLEIIEKQLNKIKNDILQDKEMLSSLWDAGERSQQAVTRSDIWREYFNFLQQQIAPSLAQECANLARENEFTNSFYGQKVFLLADKGRVYPDRLTRVQLSNKPLTAQIWLEHQSCAMASVVAFGLSQAVLDHFDQAGPIEKGPTMVERLLAHDFSDLSKENSVWPLHILLMSLTDLYDSSYAVFSSSNTVTDSTKTTPQTAQTDNQEKSDAKATSPQAPVDDSSPKGEVHEQSSKKLNNASASLILSRWHIQDLIAPILSQGAKTSSKSQKQREQNDLSAQTRQLTAQFMWDVENFWFILEYMSQIPLQKRNLARLVWDLSEEQFLHQAIRLHKYNQIQYFHKESFAAWIDMLFRAGHWQLWYQHFAGDDSASDPFTDFVGEKESSSHQPREVISAIINMALERDRLKDLAAQANYRWLPFLELLEQLE